MSVNASKVVVITAQGRSTFSEEQASSLEAHVDVSFGAAMGRLSEDEIVARLGDADYAGLTPRSVPVIKESWVGRLPRLKGIAVFATGADSVDTEYLRKRGIKLSRLPVYSTDSVAEHTIGLLLAMSRKIHLSQDRVRGRVPSEKSVLGWELRGRTIGIIGLGRIGSRVAELASAFGMRVLGYDPYRQSERAALVSLDELLFSSDVVSLHYPAQWRGVAAFGREELARMKPGATLLNVSRCALVDPLSVVDAIDAGTLKGYALDDIFPIGNADERALRQIAEGQILQTGHTAWYSEEVIERGYDCWIDNLIGMATGNFRNPSP
ncbi:hypothetical protein D7Z26_20065 [Cohnella endophytica]|uniref:Hydroxyacid dehydrogenase n=1 Tax=Cohnella endophytica TaxID=2419778 RepID=A0A494XN29_9BACL|nr:NAD(P)-dependent oxidoreductase [Cohnella endophytica]RKP50106.1 hypothetical protein D7Z26_20065 [Cohnella endophytica]